MQNSSVELHTELVQLILLMCNVSHLRKRKTVFATIVTPIQTGHIQHRSYLLSCTVLTGAVEVCTRKYCARPGTVLFSTCGKKCKWTCKTSRN